MQNGASYEVPAELYAQLLEVSRDTGQNLEALLSEAVAAMVILERITPTLDELLESGRNGSAPDWLVGLEAAE